MDMNQYLDIFIEESKEHLQDMNQLLLKLEASTDDLSLLNEIFRIAHTLKGMSGTMGYVKMANLTHEMENVLQSIRNKEIEANEHIIDVLFECFDTLEEYVNGLIKNGVEGDLDPKPLIKKLSNIMNNNSMEKSHDEEDIKDEENNSKFTIDIEDITYNIINKARESNFSSFKIMVVLNPECMLKAARAFIVFNTLEKFGEIIRSKPSAEEIEDEKFDNAFEIIYITKLDENTIRNEILNISEINEVVVERIKVEGNINKPQKIKETKKINKPVSKNNDKPKKEEKSNKLKSKTSKTVRVDIDRLDNLMNLVSELIIIKTRLEDIEDSKLNTNMNEAVEYLERITTSLHDAVMKVRMVPIERTFNRFPRMVRDLSKELGKEIKLYMTGEETEVDRTVIDEIGDPLIHLLRNSIDHGIEDPKTREELGKPKAGNVYLRAYPDGNNVVIEVEDDGSGISIEKVRDKALSKGLVSKETIANMNNDEIVNLLFKPGFSTAEKISDISGRGVGLDVVKTKIESLGGLVEVHSEMNMGSKFIIRLPLTLAIIQALMVTIGDEKYALPLNSIKEIATIKTNTIRKVHNQEVVLFRNNTLPILRMNEILQVNKISEDKDEMIIVVVKKGDKIAGLVVDNLIGQQEVVIKSLGKYLSGIKVIAGATILGNGQIALIVDPNSLF
ncbi:chemotaxis protein CheA [Paramaledivibacter caminithermalis]|uniref:Chemotaxis protein CheA n=1 Tax=Paramaledivibacter caminithermalis (strain DSM 15212 / CIP 107654 / DViRD3) TaxID=1121301 RepID=A0A1M6N6H3_PARC5|nr:chemotaxis protein CheA [Paramaledivibacter caminithermalis]SHJ91318.1 two-component system, chemotaxis family, sensor kinase CheA [Paramaledivibacter caminithermalis DSM 15212]